MAGAELLDLGNEDLVALKIVRLGHRKRLTKILSELKARKNGKSMLRSTCSHISLNDYCLSEDAGEGEEGTGDDRSDDDHETKRQSWGPHNFVDALLDGNAAPPPPPL